MILSDHFETAPLQLAQPFPLLRLSGVEGPVCGRFDDFGFNFGSVHGAAVLLFLFGFRVPFVGPEVPDQAEDQAGDHAAGGNRPGQHPGQDAHEAVKHSALSGPLA